MARKTHDNSSNTSKRNTKYVKHSLDTLEPEEKPVVTDIPMEKSLALGIHVPKDDMFSVYYSNHTSCSTHARKYLLDPRMLFYALLALIEMKKSKKQCL